MPSNFNLHLCMCSFVCLFRNRVSYSTGCLKFYVGDDLDIGPPVPRLQVLLPHPAHLRTLMKITTVVGTTQVYIKPI